MQRIVYLMSGPAHLPYLLTSLYTLRRYWDGPIDVASWLESWDIVRRIARDPSLDVQPLLREPKYQGKNGQFMDKIRLAQGYPAEDTILYLDADTTIHGKLDKLFDSAETYGFAATQFCEWTSNVGIARGRLETLLEFPEIPGDLVQRAMTERWPSVNGGVWAANPRSLVLPNWYEWTMHAKSTFIADEKVLHLMQLIYVPQGEMTTLTGGRWNCSTMNRFRPPTLKDKEVIINHYHGDSNTRPDKSPQGYARWWEVYQECLARNIGGIREWHATVHNKYLDRLERNGRSLLSVASKDP